METGDNDLGIGALVKGGREGIYGEGLAGVRWKVSVGKGFVQHMGGRGGGGEGSEVRGGGGRGMLVFFW